MGAVPEFGSFLVYLMLSFFALLLLRDNIEYLIGLGLVAFFVVVRISDVRQRGIPVYHDSLADIREHPDDYAGGS